VKGLLRRAQRPPYSVSLCLPGERHSYNVGGSAAGPVLVIKDL
jgi:hypothetical protein